MDVYYRRRKWILLAAAGASCYGAYRLYNLPSIVEKRRKVSKFLEALVLLAEAASSSAETVSLVASDLNRFLRSDSDEVPAILKQVSKLSRSDEFSGAVARVAESLTVGIVRGIGSSSNSGEGGKSEFTDCILDRLFSSSGCGFASVVVGSFARNLVIGFYSSGGSNQDSGSGSMPSWIHWICGDDKCRSLVANCIQQFVSSAVAVYLEITMEINAFDEFFTGITNPKHEAKLKELLVSICNGAIETTIKTSHQVLTNSTSTLSVNGVELEKKETESSVENDKMRFFNVKEHNGGWFDQVSSTLAVPSNRSFVLDVTGRVTFETVRSFLDFMLWKLYDGAMSSVHAVHGGVVERGARVVRYFSAKSMLVVTICIALCMRVLSGTRVLMPA